MMTFVAKLGRHMEIICGEVRIYAGVDNSFCELTDKRKKWDGAKVLEDFIVELQSFKNGNNMSFFESIKVGGREWEVDKDAEVREEKFKVFFY